MPLASVANRFNDCRHQFRIIKISDASHLEERASSPASITLTNVLTEKCVSVWMENEGHRVDSLPIIIPG